MSEDDLNDNERLLLLRSIRDRSIHKGDSRAITLSNDEIKALIWGKNLLVENPGQRILLRAFLERITKTNVSHSPFGAFDGGRTFDVMSRMEREALGNVIFWASSDYVNRKKKDLSKIPSQEVPKPTMDDEVQTCYNLNFDFEDCKTRGPDEEPCAQYQLCHDRETPLIYPEEDEPDD